MMLFIPSSAKRRTTPLPAIEPLENRRYLAITFSQTINTPATNLSSTVATADFNGDTIADLATVTQDPTSGNEGFEIWTGNGDGTFTAGATATLAMGPNGFYPQTPLVVGDVNGDGLPDVIGISEQTSGNFNGTITTYLNQGAGTFAAGIVSTFQPATGSTGFVPGDAVVGDFNGDGRADVAVEGVANSGGTGVPEIAILLGQANGTFSESGVYMADTTGLTAGLDEALVAGNFTTSGHQDIALDNEGNLDVLLGNGDGTFSVVPTSTSIQLGPVLAAGDFNNDGKTDLLTGGLGSDAGGIATLLSNGDGTFSEQSIFDTGTPVAAVATADFDQDGNLDAATDNGVVLGNGAGTFTAEVGLSLGSSIMGYSHNLVTPALGAGQPPGLVAVDANGIETVENTATGSSRAATSVTLTTSAAQINSGDTLVLTATVTPTNTSTPAATGTVTFLDSGAVIGSSPVADDGSSILSISTLATGAHSITASYSGDGNYFGSVSTAVAEQVGASTGTGGGGGTGSGGGGDTGSGGGSGGGVTGTPVGTTTLPASIVAGVAFRGDAVVDIANAATSTVRGYFTIQLYVSSEQILDSTATSLFKIKRLLAVKAGATAPLALPVKVLPAALTDGTYYLLAQITDPKKAVSSGLLGTAIAVQAPVITLTDHITKLTLPNAAVTGAPTNSVIWAMVTNNGNITVRGTTTIGIYALEDGSPDENSYLIRSVKARIIIPVGQSRLVKLALGRLPKGLSGNYGLAFEVIDPMGNFSADTSNDLYTISPPFVSLSATVGAVTPASVSVVNGVGSIQITVDNAGNTASVGNLTVNLGVSTDNATQTGTLLNQIIQAHVPANGEKIIRLGFVVPAGFAAGTYVPTIDITDAAGNTTGLIIGNTTFTVG